MSLCISNIDVRRTVIEFGRCFLSGSIAGRSLRISTSIAVAMKLLSAFTRFSMCNHSSKIVFSECRKYLLLAGYLAEQILSSAGRAACAISSSSLTVQSEIQKTVSSIITSVINKSIATREKYHRLFEAHQTDDMRLYNEFHKGEQELAILKTRNGCRKHNERENLSQVDRKSGLLLISEIFREKKMLDHARIITVCPIHIAQVSLLCNASVVILS